MKPYSDNQVPETFGRILFWTLGYQLNEEILRGFVAEPGAAIFHLTYLLSKNTFRSLSGLLEALLQDCVQHNPFSLYSGLALRV